jgi:hypothetical protein
MTVAAAGDSSRVVFFEALAPVVLRAAPEPSPMIDTLCACAISGHTIAAAASAALVLLVMIVSSGILFGPRKLQRLFPGGLRKSVGCVSRGAA